MAAFQFIRNQKINATIDELWDFISSPGNLKEITPDYMGFDITSKKLPTKMYPGMIITYKVSPLLGIKMDWVTEITHVREKEFFVDEQRLGPYVMWHHQHHLIPIQNGVLMQDIVTYIPPLGFLGAIANRLMIKHKLNEIFDYRKDKMESIFGPYSQEVAGLVRNAV
jgi:ligand-binding SRPBCC domain-containing protein